MAPPSPPRIYLGAPPAARRMKDIPPEKFDANALGGSRQHEPRRRRKVPFVDLPIGRVTRERAEAYGLDFAKWHLNYHAALGVDLKEIQKRGTALGRRLSGRKRVRIVSDAGTDLRFETKPIPPVVDDGIVDPADIRRGFVETSLPAGKLEGAVRPESVNGEVHATDPIFLAGRTLVRPWFKIEAGGGVEKGGGERGGLVSHTPRQNKVSTARGGVFSVGLHPLAGGGGL